MYTLKTLEHKMKYDDGDLYAKSSLERNSDGDLYGKGPLKRYLHSLRQNSDGKGSSSLEQNSDEELYGKKSPLERYLHRRKLSPKQNSDGDLYGKSLIERYLHVTLKQNSDGDLYGKGSSPLDGLTVRNSGYLYGKSSLGRNSDYVISYKFVKEYLQLDDSIFSHQDNCYYLSNYCHIENRGGHRYLRPSKCTKFVLKQGYHLFNNYEWTYSYHGTSPENIKSILKHGLKLPGSFAGDKKIQPVHGSAYGAGIYTSKIPLYAQLFAPVISWNGKYFQTIFMVRQKSDSIDPSEGEGTYTANMLGCTDLHKLYKGKISSNEMQYVCFDESSCVLHGLLIKVHDNHPKFDDDGEYHEIVKLLNNLK